ncbi:MAG: SHOCT domain-containing protein [Actinobacteria bacterium]|nr:SHOCT domain-containing protein [Actinomycetota bacterium]
MMFWYGEHWAFWQLSLMSVAMFVFWGLLIWAVYALITKATRQPRRHDDGGTAREVLDRRLARGDIDEAEYQRLRDLLRHDDQQKEPASRGSAR